MVAIAIMLLAMTVARPAGAAGPLGPALSADPPEGEVTTTVPTPVTTTTAKPIVTTTTRPAPTSTLAPSSSTTSTAVAPESSTTSTTGLAGPPGTDPGVSTTTTPGGDEVQADEVPPEEQDLINRYRDIESKSADLTTQLEILNGGIAAAQRDSTDAQAKLDKAERDLADTERKLTETEDQLDVARGLLRDRAVAAYIGGSMALGADTAMLEADNIDDLGKSKAYGHAVVEDEQSIIRDASDLHRRYDDLQHQAELDRDAAKKARDDVTARQTDLEHKRDDIVKAEGDLAKTAQAKIALMSEAAQQLAAVQQGYNRVQAVRDSIANTLAKREDGQTPPKVMLGIFLSPIPHPKINQPFGASVDPLYGVSRGHPGIDINGSMGTPIRAPADGTVVAAGWIDGYGNCTIIDHGNALGTLYGHQSIIAVKEGDTVKRGQVIGFVGSTGYSTGPHLHWEVRVLGNVVDPAPFIGDQN